MIGRTLGGGTEALVVEATTSGGRAAVLKVFPPGQEAAAGEVETLVAAGGHGYAEVYAVDESHGAILLERLGPPLADMELPIDSQITIICETLNEAWAAPLDGHRYTSGAEKAESLRDFINATWRDSGHPCPSQVIETALRFAEERRRSFDLHSAVLAHGDAHPWNTLLVPGTRPNRFKLIDPDGLFVERAYDLAILMREWTGELLAGDPLQLGLARCYRLAELAGVEPEAVWQWGLLERTSTGLLCVKLGLGEGHEMLTVVQRWIELPSDHFRR
ncbi:aminoglycoside phosphotransferase family protein [Vacuolonema iberomarrocanum]|uniref:aminoglycoside phosphotransferase family protein n=1 Tax=Vacuolonema iberomarrocanum TaxID=3454632 RepID=UPI0019ECCA5B|nr:phosphotransferase [filamentous cyanobacterium LEGE 07170]